MTRIFRHGTDRRRTQKGTDADADAPEAKDPELPDNPDKLYRETVTSKNAVRVEPGGTPDVEAPQYPASSYDLELAENSETGSIVGNAVQVVPELDDDGNPKFTYSYSLGDTITGDEAYFDIDEASGQIRVGSVDFADPTPAGVVPLPSGATPGTGDPDNPAKDDPTLDYESGDTFTLIVTATDEADGSRKAIATVNISLMNLNERPYFDKASRDAVTDEEGATEAILYSEHRTNAVIAQLVGVKPDGEELRWELTGADAGAFEIADADDIDADKDRVQIVFKNQPNFESPDG